MNIVVLYADDWRFDTPEKYQTMMKNYYRLASEVDTVCGRVLDALKSQGVLDNTLVLFTTDNGYYLPGSEALVGKDWKYFYWPDQNVEQLLDLRTDPQEENDLAAHPEQAKRLTAMRQRFAQLKAEAR